MSSKLKDIRELKFEEMMDLVNKAEFEYFLTLVEEFNREMGYRVGFNREILNNMVYYTIEPSNRPYELQVRLIMVFNTGLRVEVRFIFNVNTRILDSVFIKSYLPIYSLD